MRNDATGQMTKTLQEFPLKVIRILEDTGYFSKPEADREILGATDEVLRRAALRKNQKIIPLLTESFGDTDLAERATLHYSGPEGEKLARLLTKTDVRFLEKAVIKDLGAGELEAATTRNLAAPWRARKILETETHCAFQAVGVEDAAREGRARKTWHTQGDRRVRPTHRALSGVTISIDAVFWNGSSCPSDPFCRCYLTFSGEGTGRDLALW